MFSPNVPNFITLRDVVAVEPSDAIKPSDILYHVAHITLGGVNGDSQIHCLFQFVTPLIQRIRYNPKYTSLTDFEDTNTHVISLDNWE
jgi:hypothetical protein